MPSPTGDGTDGPYTWQDLTADINELIAMGLVAVTGDRPDERFCLTAEGLHEMERWQRETDDEARELAKARRAASQAGIVINLPLPGA